MTDQIYYKVQYPLKKAINKIKKIDPSDPFAGKDPAEMNKYEIDKLESFVEMWEEEGKKNLKKIIKNLRDSQ